MVPAGQQAVRKIQVFITEMLTVMVMVLLQPQPKHVQHLQVMFLILQTVMTQMPMQNQVKPHIIPQTEVMVHLTMTVAEELKIRLTRYGIYMQTDFVEQELEVAQEQRHIGPMQDLSMEVVMVQVIRHAAVQVHIKEWE